MSYSLSFAFPRRKVLREKEDRWGHSDPGVDSDGFKGQDDPGQWMPRAEAEDKGSGPQRYVWSLFSFSSFFKSKAFMWTGGKDSWCFIFFYFFYRVFRIWLAPAPSQLFTCGLWSLFLLSALWEKDAMFPCWENRSSERAAFTTSPDWCVTAEPQVKSQSCLAHVLSTTSSCLPCHYNGKLLASVKTSVPLVTREKRQGN